MFDKAPNMSLDNYGLCEVLIKDETMRQCASRWWRNNGISRYMNFAGLDKICLHFKETIEMLESMWPPGSLH